VLSIIERDDEAAAGEHRDDANQEGDESDASTSSSATTTDALKPGVADRGLQQKRRRRGCLVVPAQNGTMSPEAVCGEMRHDDVEENF
jgi:hypothetical protein